MPWGRDLKSICLAMVALLLKTRKRQAGGQRKGAVDGLVRRPPAGRDDRVIVGWSATPQLMIPGSPQRTASAGSR